MKKPLCFLLSMVTFLLCGAEGEFPSQELSDSLTPASKTGELLDLLLSLEALAYLEKPFSHANNILGGLSYVSFPPDDCCYFEYNLLKDFWFTYDSKAPACWYERREGSCLEGVPLSRVYEEMSPGDTADSVRFLLDRVPLFSEGFAPDETITGSALENGLFGGKLYSFWYKDRMFELHTDERGLISDDCLVVIAI